MFSSVKSPDTMRSMETNSGMFPVQWELTTAEYWFPNYTVNTRPVMENMFNKYIPNKLQEIRMDRLDPYSQRSYSLEDGKERTHITPKVNHSGEMKYAEKLSTSFIQSLINSFAGFSYLFI